MTFTKRINMQTAGAAGLLAVALSVPAIAAEKPSFDCGKVQAGSIEEQVCQDAGLTKLDQQLAEVYAQAADKAKNEQPPMLKAMQRGWVKGRNECWKSEDKRACVESSYQTRIAELQAQYRLVEMTGPIFYVCDGNPANEVVVSYFKTEPATLIAERGDQTSLMFVQPSGSGAKYQGRNESLWEHHGEAKIVWGYEAPEMTCVVKPQ
ncbi:MliC family protein [Shewanella sp. GD03713]|uniref:MliC family protein n=2 Tax=Shewanella TaxID=22 RepID=UPI000B344778|nr:MliC family protein [Shewanella sp. GD03713]MDH1468483.1 MliC family protein [Shewanella sp. GD03713]QXN25147.1 MliC family protein [Shewanella putrefaciens]